MEPAMPSSHVTPTLGHWSSTLASALDVRSARRLALLLLGAVRARGRRTVTRWIRAANLSTEFRPCYNTVAAAGQRADLIAAHVAHAVVKPWVASAARLTLALDDTPTPRSGPHVQGAGTHHNPTRGPAGAPFVYGHVGVVLGLLAAHPTGGTLALPLLARLYIRRKDLTGIPSPHRPLFRTKLERAVELVRGAVAWLGFLGKPLGVVVDGAYAKAPFLKPVGSLGVTVVSRLRKDAHLRTLPRLRPGQRGRPRLYGEHRLDLRKRAGKRRGWATDTFHLHGKATSKRSKTFLATWPPVGGVIRVVLVDGPTGWVASFCTDAGASVGDLLGCGAGRFYLETTFRDCKEIVGAGQQQVRLRRATSGAFHLCLWTFTLTECWAWARDAQELVDHRSRSPWDDKARRPSHADKQRASRREWLAAEIHAVLSAVASEKEIQTTTDRLLNFAA
jgi:hypothetical protein